MYVSESIGSHFLHSDRLYQVIIDYLKSTYISLYVRSYFVKPFFCISSFHNSLAASFVKSAYSGTSMPLYLFYDGHTFAWSVSTKIPVEYVLILTVNRVHIYFIGVNFWKERRKGNSLGKRGVVYRFPLKRIQLCRVLPKQHDLFNLSKIAISIFFWRLIRLRSPDSEPDSFLRAGIPVQLSRPYCCIPAL